MTNATHKIIVFIQRKKKDHVSGGAHVVVTNMLDCNIIISNIKLLSHYYVHFQTNTPGKGMKPP